MDAPGNSFRCRDLDLVVAVLLGGLKLPMKFRYGGRLGAPALSLSQLSSAGSSVMIFRRGIPASKLPCYNERSFFAHCNSVSGCS